MQFEDWLAIHNLINRYPQCADVGDYDGVGEFYAHAVLSVTGHSQPYFRAEGAKKLTEQYTKMVRKFPDRGTPRTRHLLTNIIITDDGRDRAKAQSYVTVFQQTDKMPLQAIISGTYFDTFAKVDGAWRLVERLEDMELVGDLSEHMLFGDPLNEASLKDI